MGPLGGPWRGLPGGGRTDKLSPRKHLCFQSRPLWQTPAGRRGIRGGPAMSMVEAGRGGTRERILVLLRRHGRLSAPQLADLLELTPVGVRRHLTLLERDGLVTARVEKPKRGRPAAVYRLTDAGLETFPRHYDEVASEALAFLKRQDASVLSQFLAWRNERLAASYAKRVDGATLAERARALADVLSEQGYMAEVESTPGGLRLCQHNCTVEPRAPGAKRAGANAGTTTTPPCPPRASQRGEKPDGHRSPRPDAGSGADQPRAGERRPGCLQVRLARHGRPGLRAEEGPVARRRRGDLADEGRARLDAGVPSPLARLLLPPAHAGVGG